MTVEQILAYVGGKMPAKECFEKAKYFDVTDLWTGENWINESGRFSVSGLEGCDNLTIRVAVHE